MAFIETNNIKGDVFGGITAGIVALPLALAFGIQAFGGVDSPEASSIGALAGLVGAQPSSVAPTPRSLALRDR